MESKNEHNAGKMMAAWTIWTPCRWREVDGSGGFFGVKTDCNSIVFLFLRLKKYFPTMHL